MQEYRIQFERTWESICRVGAMWEEKERKSFSCSQALPRNVVCYFCSHLTRWCCRQRGDPIMVLKPLQHHGSMVPRGLRRALKWTPLALMLRCVSLLDGR